MTGAAGVVTEFPVPQAASAPLGSIAAGPDGNLWFTETLGDKIGQISPAGNVTEFTVGTPGELGTQPSDIVAGPDGSLWFTQSNTNQIGRITPAGDVSEFTLPPGDSLPQGLAVGTDGNLWFAAGATVIGRMTPAGTIATFHTPTADSAPTYLAAGPDGNIWFTEQAGNQIGRITPSGTVTEFPLPSPGSQPLGITAGPDGNVWFTESGAGHANLRKIGRITPSGTITEFPVPAGTGAGPSIAAGPDGNLWFTDPVGNGVGRITPSGTITNYSIPTTTSGPWGIAAGPDGNIWFAEENANKIGELSTGVLPASQQPPTLSGPATVGAPIHCQSGPWTTWAGQQPSLSAFGYDGYQWLLDGDPITGETGQSYTPVAAEVGQQLSCTVTATYTLLSVTVAATSAAPSVSQVGGAVLASGASLSAGQSLTSGNGRYRLAMQGDGNLVEYSGATVLWATGTSSAGSSAVMQPDGNLVVESAGSAGQWASGTGGTPGAYLELADTGQLEVVSPSGALLWGPGVLPEGGSLSAGQSLLSANGRYRLSLQGDGNLVEYGGATVMWAAATNPAGSIAVMQGDGNLVVYAARRGGAVGECDRRQSRGVSGPLGRRPATGHVIGRRRALGPRNARVGWVLAGRSIAPVGQRCLPTDDADRWKPRRIRRLERRVGVGNEPRRFLCGDAG